MRSTRLAKMLLCVLLATASLSAREPKEKKSAVWWTVGGITALTGLLGAVTTLIKTIKK